MKKKDSNKVLYIISGVCIALVIALCGFIMVKHNKNVLTDAERFKEEYEIWNDVETEDKKNKYPSVSIDANNPIVYKSPKEIVNIMENEEAIIYFGYAYCPWCRNSIETLLEVAKDNNVNVIYYVDIKDIRDEYVFDGTIKPKQTKKGADAYYQIVDILKERLENYYVKDKNGNEYGTGVKRLFAPTVVKIKDKEIIGIHTSTVETHTNPYGKLTEEQKQELYDIYKEFVVLSDDFCSENAC